MTQIIKIFQKTCLIIENKSSVKSNTSFFNDLFRFFCLVSKKVLQKLKSELLDLLEDLPKNLRTPSFNDFPHHLDLLILLLKEYSTTQKHLKFEYESFSSSMDKTTCSEKNSYIRNDGKFSKEESINDSSKKETILESSTENSIGSYTKTEQESEKIKVTEGKRKNSVVSDIVVNLNDKIGIEFHSVCDSFSLDLSDEESEISNELQSFPNFELNEQKSPKDFFFLKMLNKGGYGEIWLASRKKTGDFYAIKVINMLNKVI